MGLVNDLRSFGKIQPDQRSGTYVSGPDTENKWSGIEELNLRPSRGFRTRWATRLSHSPIRKKEAAAPTLQQVGFLFVVDVLIRLVRSANQGPDLSSSW